MNKLRVVAVGLMFLLSGAVSAGGLDEQQLGNGPSSTEAFSFQEALTASDGGTDEAKQPIVVANSCCKVCRKGKACGNSCININYTCHKPPGCACDGIRMEIEYMGAQ